MGKGVRIRLDVQRDDITPHLRQLAQRLGSLKEPLTVIGSNLVTSAKMRFRRSVGPAAAFGDPVPWPALADATIAHRRRRKRISTRRHGDEKPLIDTSSLLRSIAMRVTGAAVQVGTNHQVGKDATAAIHQLGGKAGRGHNVTVPKRSFLGVDDDDARMIERTVASYLGVTEAA